MSQQNDTSNLLTQEENDLVFTIIGHRKQVKHMVAILVLTDCITCNGHFPPVIQSKATAVVQMYHASPTPTQWTRFKTGVVCFVKDNVKKTYYIRLVDITVRDHRF